MGALIFKAGLTAVIVAAVYLFVWRHTRSPGEEFGLALGVCDVGRLTIAAVLVGFVGLVATALGAILWLWGL